LRWEEKKEEMDGGVAAAGTRSVEAEYAARNAKKLYSRSGRKETTKKVRVGREGTCGTTRMLKDKAGRRKRV